MDKETYIFNDDDFKDEFAEMSEFKLLIAQHRLEYIKSNISNMQQIINGYKLSIELEDNTITLSTTKRTRDPYAIIKLRDIVNIILKGVPYEKALNAFTDEFVVDNILFRNSKTSENRRKRLEGPGGETMKAIMLLTKTELFLSRNCLCVIANSYKALKEVRWIVENVFEKNVHPAYLLKRMMVKKEIQKDGEKAGMDWEKYLPPIKSKIKNKRGDGKKKKAEKRETKSMEMQEEK